MTKNKPTEQSSKTFWSEVSFKFVIISLLFLASLFIFGFIAHETVTEKEDLFDSAVTDLFSSHMNKNLIRFMRWVTFFGSHWFLIPAYIIVVLYFLFTGRTRAGVNTAIIAISSTALTFGLKRLFQRDRPDYSLLESIKTYSFPSGHSLSSFIFCCLMIYLVWESKFSRIWKFVLSFILLLFSFFVGISRIVLNLHYASDVVAGFCLGFAWVILSFLILKNVRFSKRR